MFYTRVKTVVSVKDLPCKADIKAGLLKARDTRSILRYLQPRNGLPDSKGSLSLYLPPQAIALVNSKVEKATSDGSRK